MSNPNNYEFPKLIKLLFKINNHRKDYSFIQIEDYSKFIEKHNNFMKNQYYIMKFINEKLSVIFKKHGAIKFDVI